MSLGVQDPWGTSFPLRCSSSQVHFTNTAGTIPAAPLSERRAIGRGALCNHPGAELGTDKKKNPVNLSDTLACVRTKRMLTHRHNWRDHAVPAFPPARQFPSLHSCAGTTIPQRNDKKKKKRGKKEITKPISSTDTKLAMSLWGRMALVVLTRETPCVFDPNSEKQKKKKKKAGFFFF